MEGHACTAPEPLPPSVFKQHRTNIPLFQLQRHLRPRHRSVWQGNHLSSHRWYEGQGRPRRVFRKSSLNRSRKRVGILTRFIALALRRHVGLAGRRRQVQGSRYHRPPHQGTSPPLCLPSPLIHPNPPLLPSSEPPAVPEPSSPVPEPNPHSEVSPDPVSESVESRTLPRLLPTRPDERVVDEVDDCRLPFFLLLGIYPISRSGFGLSSHVASFLLFATPCRTREP